MKILLFTLALLSTSTYAHTLSVFVDGQWVQMTHEHGELPGLNENWAEDHLNDPDTGFNNPELNW